MRVSLAQASQHYIVETKDCESDMDYLIMLEAADLKGGNPVKDCGGQPGGDENR